MLVEKRRESVLGELIVREYIKERSMRKVASKLGLTVGEVARVLKKACGPFYGLRGVCRLYLTVREMCFISAPEASKLLGTTSQNVYYLFRQLSAMHPGFRVVTISAYGRKYVYLVRDACMEKFRKEVARNAEVE